MDFSQKTDYTCGPACLNFVHEHLGQDSPGEDSLSKKLGSKPVLGTENQSILSYCQNAFPGCFLGEYQGGLALANIRNWRDGVGHYVVFLRGDREKVLIFDPFDGKIHKRPWGSFNFESGCSHFKNWSINIPKNI